RKTTVALEELVLNETMPGLLSMLQRLIGEDIHLVWQPAATCWPITMDPTQLANILTNLCVNSRDAIADVGTIAISTANCVIDAEFCATHVDASPGDYVRLTVRDTGSGMDAVVLSHIFEPFFTTKAAGEGTGLGLASVHGAVRQNNGFITVSSAPGEGTAFDIYLPRMEGEGHATQQSGDIVLATSGRETILLVEDEPAILRLVTRVLAVQGYAVLAVSGAAEALRLAREYAGEIHLLLTDVVMPEMNGRDLAQSLLAIRPEIKRLFMSAHTAGVIAHRGILVKGVPFIEKPFSSSALGAKVREVLDAGHGRAVRSD
ncbi:MAG TPA: ATP-binding protein, partial [Gemmatimonadaceae bacterium]